jgi:hypothetical protein
MKLKPLDGLRFGKLLVLARAPDKVFSKGRKSVAWRCRCDCGREVTVIRSNLASGHSKSCGCLKVEACSRTFRKHGLTDSKVHKIWCDMKARCTNPNADSYPIYGARGIIVCERWATSFESFVADMGHPPSPSHSLDRIDPNGNYEPQNCRWATRYEQANNKRNTKFYTFDGKTMTIPDWSRYIGVKASILHNRINRQKWPIERAIRTKPRPPRYPKTA